MLLWRLIDCASVAHSLDLELNDQVSIARFRELTNGEGKTPMQMGPTLPGADVIIWPMGYSIDIQTPSHSKDRRPVCPMSLTWTLFQRQFALARPLFAPAHRSAVPICRDGASQQTMASIVESIVQWPGNARRTVTVTKQRASQRTSQGQIDSLEELIIAALLDISPGRETRINPHRPHLTREHSN